MDLTAVTLDDLKKEAVTDAEGTVKKNLGKVVALLTAELQRQSDGDPFALQKLTDNLVSSMQSGQGLGTASKAATPPAAELPPAPQQKSEAEELGEELLKLSGDSTNARRNLQVLNKIQGSGNHDLMRYLSLVVTNATADPVVEFEGQLMPTSHREALRSKRGFQRLYDDLIHEIFEGSIPVVDSAKLFAQVRTMLSDLRTKAAAPSDDAFADELARVSTVKRAAGETPASYIDRVAKALTQKGASGGVTQLLDEIGRVVGEARGTRDDAAYQSALLTRLSQITQGSANYNKLWQRLQQVAQANGIAVQQGDTPAVLAMRIAQHGRRRGGSLIDPPAGA